MYSTFISVVLLLKLKSFFAQDLIFIVASDKESLKSSLLHVDRFLKQVGQRIDTERSFLQTVGRRNAPTPKIISRSEKSVTIDGVSNEDYANLWFGGNKFDNHPKNTTNRQKDIDKRLNKGFPNFYKAIATFDEEELKKGTTIKLVNAVHDLKGLVESDVDVKSYENSTKFDTLRKIQEELKHKDKVIPIGRSNTKKSKRDNDGEFDVFGSMEFPEDSNLPVGITPKTTAATGGGAPPEVLDENFIIQHEDMPGPRPEIMSTPSTTTDDNEPLLNPKDFGYTTTHKPLPTYGDVVGPPAIDPKNFQTPPPDDFVSSLKADMEKFHMGVFSIALLKLFHMVIWKDQAEGRRIAVAMGHTLQQQLAYNKFDDFGELTKNAVVSVANIMSNMPYDEMRSEVVMLHNALLHRRELFSTDVNSLIDHIDSLYTRQETTALLESLEPLDEHNDANDIPDTITEKIFYNFLSPWRRLKETPRGKILKESIKRSIKNHFYANGNRYPDARRSFTINIPVKLIRNIRPTHDTTTRPVPNLRNNNIQVFKIDTRRDDLNRNIYNTDLQTILKNYMTERNKQARKSQVANSKPMFIKQFKNNLNVNNKAVDNKEKNNLAKPGILRVNLNTKVTSKPNNNRIMIITNNNQAKSNVVDKPRAIFRSGDSYVDFNNENINDSLVQRANHFELEMYPDVPMVVSESPNELNFQIEADKLNLQVDDDKKLIVIDKKDAAVDKFREDVKPHKAASSSLKKRKHHKKHHKKHKRTHGHINLKEKLAKIKKIIKMYRSGRKRSKHRRHHRHNKEKEDVKSLSVKMENVPSPAANMNRNFIFNASKINSEDRRYQIKDSLATVAPVDFTTQVYAVKSNFNSRRQMMNVNRVRLRETEESDEEIALRRSLYKAMNIRGRFSSSENARQANKRQFSRGSSETDDEAVLKNKIYNYFNNIEPT